LPHTKCNILIEQIDMQRHVVIKSFALKTAVIY